jgi:uncharacterized repeat protein (TIGR02543 family)
MLSIYPQNGSANYQKMANVNNGYIQAPAAPSKAGYKFGGWYKEASCNNAWDFTKTKITGDISLYAKWLKNVAYTVNASPNKTAYGSVTGAGKYYGGTKVTLTAKPKSGYRFVRWLENSKKVSASYQYQFTASKNRKLTAEFAQIGKPSLSSVKASGNGAIIIKWKSVTGAVKYKIYRSLKKGSGYKNIAEIKSSSFTDKGLINGKTYYYKIKACCMAGNVATTGGYSNVKSAKVK